MQGFSDAISQSVGSCREELMYIEHPTAPRELLQD